MQQPQQPSQGTSNAHGSGGLPPEVLPGFNAINAMKFGDNSLVAQLALQQYTKDGGKGKVVDDDDSSEEDDDDNQEDERGRPQQTNVKKRRGFGGSLRSNEDSDEEGDIGPFDNPESKGKEKHGDSKDEPVMPFEPFGQEDTVWSLGQHAANPPQRRKSRGGRTGALSSSPPPSSDVGNLSFLGNTEGTSSQSTPADGESAFSFTARQSTTESSGSGSIAGATNTVPVFTPSSTGAATIATDPLPAVINFSAN